MDTLPPKFNSLRDKIAFEKVARKMRYTQYALDYAEAETAGIEAANHANIVPMVVSGMDANGNSMAWKVNGGVCGYAYVTLRPATTSFARWLVKEHGWRKAYEGGISLMVSDYNQSMGRKAAHAEAMAKSLKGKGYSGVDWFERID